MLIFFQTPDIINMKLRMRCENIIDEQQFVDAFGFQHACKISFISTLIHYDYFLTGLTKKGAKALP